MKSKLIRIAIFIGIVLCIAGGFIVKELFTNNIIQSNEPREFFISRDARLDEVIQQLNSDGILKDIGSFKRWCKLLRYNDSTVKGGRYLFKEKMTNFQIISKLRLGSQDPVNIAIHGVRDIPQLAGRLSRFLETDSLSFLAFLTDTTIIDSLSYTPENFISLFIPNTYQVYWNISKEKLLAKMIQEHDKFWTKNNRKQKLDSLKLNTKQVYALASIVEKETIQEEEKPAIAGVYLNRLNTNMKLQADPTVVFGLGLFGTQRVLFEHLETPNPYNTYLNEGLPPGPICMPSLSSIDAVLNPEQHEYIFFCAKPGTNGSHNFAKTLAGHGENARLYREWLNSNKIK